MIELVVVWVLWGAFIMEDGKVESHALERFASEKECKDMLPVVEQGMHKAYPDNPGYYECVKHRLPKVPEKR